MGTPRSASHSGVVLVSDSNSDPPLGGSCAPLPRRVPCPTIRYDLDGWNMGPQANWALEEVGIDPPMGRPGFWHLACQFCAQQHPLAGCRILYSRWQACACDADPS